MIKKYNIIITGAGGFLGSHICRYFSERGHNIAAIGRLLARPQLAQQFRNLWKLCDITLPDRSFIDIVREFKPTIIIHCAGTSSVTNSMKNPYTDFQNTVETCAFVLETIRKEAPLCRFIFLSSAAVYGNPLRLPIYEDISCRPISPYGYHKFICEQLVEEFSALYQISGTILRIFSAYGEGLRRQVIFDLCKKFAEPGIDVVEVYGTGKESRDFIHAFDVAQAIECVSNKKVNGIFNLASGQQTTIATLVQLIKEEFKSTKPVYYTGSVRQGDPLYWQADIKKINSIGYTPIISLRTGIKNYCQWFNFDKKGDSHDK